MFVHDSVLILKQSFDIKLEREFSNRKIVKCYEVDCGTMLVKAIISGVQTFNSDSEIICYIKWEY